MTSARHQIPWEEIGAEEGKRLVSTHRWRYEFCIFRMFWLWYVANTPRLANAGATRPLLDAYLPSSYRAMVVAGLLADNEKDRHAWDGDLEERFAAYDSAREQFLQPGSSLRVTGRGSVGWVLSLYVFPDVEPDFSLVWLLNDLGNLTLIALADMFKSIEGQYGGGAKPWWKFWQWEGE